MPSEDELWSIFDTDGPDIGVDLFQADAMPLQAETERWTGDSNLALLGATIVAHEN